MSWASVYRVVRELHDPNRFEEFDGQASMLKAMGQPYAELAMVRVVDTRSKSAIAAHRVQLRAGGSGRPGNRVCGQTCAAASSCHTF